jgi:hypothetical protein
LEEGTYPKEIALSKQVILIWAIKTTSDEQEELPKVRSGVRKRDHM